MRRPQGYAPPGFDEAWEHRQEIAERYRAFHDSVDRQKEMRRHDYDGTFSEMDEEERARAAPYALRGNPAHGDYIDRAVGKVSGNRPEAMVVADALRPKAMDAAGYEERCLNAAFRQISLQQQTDPYELGVDSMIAYGLAVWSVFPDQRVIREMDGDFRRRKGESAKAHMERYEELMGHKVPLVIRAHDPQTVLPFFSDRNELDAMIVVTEHSVLNVSRTMGYKRVHKTEGVNLKGEWGWEKGGVLFEPDVPSDISEYSGGSGARKRYSSSTAQVEKMVWCDKWMTRTWLNGVLVEEYEHDMGRVPFALARGQIAVDSDPEFAHRSLAYNALPISQAIAKWNARIAETAEMYKKPTVLFETEQKDLLKSYDWDFGKLIGFRPNSLKNLQMPLATAQTGIDLQRQLEMLEQKFQTTTISDFGKGVDAGLSGYAVSQLESNQTTTLRPAYANLRRAMADVMELIRAWTRTCFPGGGIVLKGVVETREHEGQRRHVREMLVYGEEHMTGNVIEVEIDEGIKQDQVAAHKALMEESELGYRSKHGAMELMGIDDPAREMERKRLEMLVDSDLTKQAAFELAMKRLGLIQEAVAEQENSPERTAMNDVMRRYMGGPGAQPPPPGSQPVNAPGGQPINQQLGAGGAPPNPGGAQLHLPNEGGGPQASPSGPRR